MENLRIMVIEDSPDDVLLIERTLKKANIRAEFHRLETETEVRRALVSEHWDAVIADYFLPRFGARKALGLLQELEIDLPFIVVSGVLEEEAAVSIMRAGADDFVSKDRITRLAPAIKRELTGAESRACRRRLERAKTEADDRYRALTESITDVFIGVDNKLGCIFWNRAAERLTGVSVNSAMGRPVYEFIEGIREKLEEALRLMRPRRTQNELVVKAGRLSFEWFVYPAGNGLSILGRDITETRRIAQLERRLHESKSFEALGILTSGVAHEVRNPLNALQTVGDALFAEIENSDQFTDYRLHMQKQIERLQNLMNDLLNYGRPMRREDAERADLRDFLKETISLWDGGSNQGKRNVVFRSGKAGHEVLIHKLQLQQVLVNLLDNASQHSPRESTITVRLLRRPEEWVIRVIDSGTGVKKEDAKRLFDPFYTKRAGGTGLGLAIARRTIDAHGGTIRIRNNTPPPGCTVEISLPATDITTTDAFAPDVVNKDNVAQAS